MCWEVEVTLLVVIAIAGRQSLSDPIFESVGFLLGLEGIVGNSAHYMGSGPALHCSLGQPESGPTTHCVIKDSNTAPLLPVATVPSQLYVNTEGGGGASVHAGGFILSSHVSFERALSKLLHPLVIATPPPKHHRRTPMPSMLHR
jgi:hypothetical protein